MNIEQLEKWIESSRYYENNPEGIDSILDTVYLILK